MPSVYDIKPRFQALLRPLTRGLARAGVTANQVTCAAVVLSMVAGILAVILPSPRGLLVLPVALFARMALNAIDGMLAREHDQKSRLGAILNEVGDVLSDAAMYGPLAATRFFEPSLILAIVALAGASELAGVMGQVLGGPRRYQGPMGKSDRALIFGALTLALGSGAPPGRWVTVVLGLIVGGLVLTTINRARAALREQAS